MKTATHSISTRLSGFGLIILAACLWFAPSARAGLTVDIHLYHDTYGYYFYPWLNANTTPPDFPTGNYMIASPQIPSGGSQLQYQATNNILTFTGGGGNYYGDFNSFLYGITNGQWSIWVTNSTSTNQYKFTVTVTGVTSNSFGAPAVAVFPTGGAQFVTNQPLFQWTGPANWAGTLNVNDDFIDANGNYNYEASASLPPNQTSWPCPVVLPNGTNDFSADYSSNITAMIIASTPTNANTQPISGWVSTSTMETHFTYDPQFIVGTTSGQADLVVNGGFETGDFTGWTVTGGGNSVDDGSNTGITPHTGTYEAGLGASGEIDYLSQTLFTTPGTSYLLSFWLNSPDGQTPNEFQVSWNGTILFDETNLPALGWTNLQFVVTATGPSTVLQFGAEDDPSYLALDDVSVVPTQAGGPGGPVVHYDFDEGTVLAPDVSGNNNNIVYAGNFGGSGPAISSDTAAGTGSVSFDGGSYLTASSNLLSTLAGEFSVSLWLKTSQSFGSQNDYAWAGAGVIAADSPNAGARDLIPVALTGGQVAFNIGDGVSDDTLNSSATVNDNTWHHVVVTRSLSTGTRQIFIDGTLDSSDIASTVLLDSPVLLTIGAKSDASDPNPASPGYNGSNGYEGLLDDVQIYNRVLSSGEVAFLYQNPGATVTSSSSIPYPVDVNLQFSFIRSQDPNLGEIYGASVSFNSVNPAPTTTNSVHSPNDYFSTEQYPGGGSGSGAILYSLGDVLNEFTNGLWKIYINQGSPTQQVYSFQVSISGLDTNLLKAVRILSPTNGAVDVPANVPFYWYGPTNFSSLSLDLAGVVELLSLPLNATNWAAAPTLSNGSQFFDLNYVSNNFPGVTFTTPVDAASNPVRTWSTAVNLSSEAFSLFFVGPNPTQLTNAHYTGTNFQFSFLSQAGVTNSVQFRTNLVLGNWLIYSNVTGNGSLKTIPIPISVFNGAKQGFIRISSQ
jgi:hypothetical protein